MNKVEISLEGVEKEPWQEAVVPFVTAVLDKLEKRNWDLSLLFCKNEYIKSLNSRYRKKEEATDVLSFVLGETDGERFLPGDIVISLEMLKENAEYFKISPDEELRRLLIHGILHLGGMDHATNDKGEAMLVLQENLLHELSGMNIVHKENRE